ncbi:MAG: 16S rRNA (adenine(1518)-N(6)/adenine(1519)-N(6))-dimethyltransferase RsmA [Polyangiaceae bacterium]
MSSRRILREHGLRPKKSFGQNFLEDPRLCAQIAELAVPEAERGQGTVVELGAGLGALTEPLLARAARVVAVERDRDLVPLLGERFAEVEHLTIVEADAARLDIDAIFDEAPPPWVLAGNLPYQITGRLVERATQLAPRLARAVFMVQREVADRLVAEPGHKDYGMLTVFTQAAFSVRRALRVSAGAFHPAPKVDSAVVVLESRRPPFTEDEAFRDLVKAAFGQRRKTLKNALKRLDGARVAASAAAAGVDLDARAETLSVETFAAWAAAYRGAT